MIIKEKYSGYWIQITSALALGTLLFLGAYHVAEDVVWEGVLRLIAFGLLAGTVLSGLKVMQGKHTIECSTENGELILTYLRKDRVVSRDIFKLGNIETVYTEPNTQFFGTGFFPGDLNIKFMPADSDRPLTLVEVHGRALALTKEDAEHLISYIHEHAPDSTDHKTG
ncbi:hypothetical protein ACG2F4_15975 [Halalkalibaculum sp. DA3122]|uniref:hypothetical protein n=1 Tax=Halalkalibaculum sp. DA3122 TaxID=3373607 RepID=UPI0037552272